MQQLAFILVTPPNCNANCEDLKILLKSIERDFQYSTIRVDTWSSNEVKSALLGITNLPGIAVVDETLRIHAVLDPAVAGQNADIKWAYDLLASYGYKPNGAEAGIQQKVMVYASRNRLWIMALIAMIVLAGVWFWKFRK